MKAAAAAGEAHAALHECLSSLFQKVPDSVSLPHRPPGSGWNALAGALAVIAITIPVFYQLGSEAMPPLDEGAILYMPTTLPGISIRQAEQLLQASDHLLSQFPEVDHVIGKAGRAESATDPAPL